MTMRHSGILVGATLAMVLTSARAEAHWCDDLWASSYNIVVRPDSDTSPKEVYVQNNMGYQLINFKLSATASSGAITLTAPTTLKVANTLLPGERGTWKIASGSPAKIEDITFSVSFGNTGQNKCYPTKGANAVMIVKTDGSLYPAAPPPGLDSPTNPGCTGDLQQGRSLQYEAVADFEDVNTGLDSLLKLYCSGRASWNSGSDQVSPSYCKDSASTTCPTNKPTTSPGTKYEYMHLWSAGELAIRKDSLGSRLAVFRARLACGVNDGDMGFAGYAAFILGYLGDDASAKTTLQALVTAGGDLGTIAKAGLYVMGDTAQKADVQAGLKATSVFVQVACAAAVGIVDKDDASVTSILIPAVKWTEPDTSDDGKGMYAAHILELVAFQRRGWVAKGVGTGTVSFYGETGGPAGTGGATGTGGAIGTGGTGGTGGVASSGGVVGGGGTQGGGGSTGSRDAGTGTDARPAVGGAIGGGGATAAAGGGASGSAGAGGRGGASAGSGGAPGTGGATGGTTTTSQGTGGGAGGAVAPGAGGTTAESKGGTSGGSTANSSGGASGSGGDTTTTTPQGGTSGGCKCNLGARGDARSLPVLMLLGLALLWARRKR